MKDYSRLQSVKSKTLAEAAFFYATEYGWHIFRLQEGSKLPLAGGNGQDEAKNNINVIAHWWNCNPKLNIGLNLVKSGLVVVDVDDHKKDECDWEAFAAGKELKPTLVQRSARGGIHYFYQAKESERYPGRLHFDDGRPVKGVDIKHNGYVVLSPSVIYPENLKGNQ